MEGNTTEHFVAPLHEIATRKNQKKKLGWGDQFFLKVASIY
jgi:hypothetical protein